MKYWLLTLLIVAVCLIALRMVPVGASPGLVSDPEIASYKHSLDHDCRTAADPAAAAAGGAAAWCSCRMATLERRLSRSDWQQAVFLARTGQQAQQARLFESLRPQLERCGITRPPAWAGSGAPPALSFEQAQQRADGQPPALAYPYEDQWFAFNNGLRLDERGGCYRRAGGATRLVLVIDQGGKVGDLIADVDDARSQCFRQIYLQRQFPPPPFAPYYLALQMG